MAQDNYCKKCRREMAALREDVVADTKYKILKCEKCKNEVARAQDY